LWSAWRQLKHYLFVVDKQTRRINPLDQISTFFMFTADDLPDPHRFRALCRGTGQASWQALAFGWVRFSGDTPRSHGTM
jgi:hypothetical protein